jgi:hypothetical protein
MDTATLFCFGFFLGMLMGATSCILTLKQKGMLVSKKIKYTRFDFGDVFVSFLIFCIAVSLIAFILI